MKDDDIKKYIMAGSIAAYVAWWYLQQHPELAKKGVVWSTLTVRLLLFAAFGYLSIKQMSNLTTEIT